MFRHQSNFYLLAFLFQHWLQEKMPEKMPNTLTELLQDGEDLRKMFPIFWNDFKEPSVNHVCQPLLWADVMAPLPLFLSAIVGCWTWFPARKESFFALFFFSLVIYCSSFLHPHIPEESSTAQPFASFPLKGVHIPALQNCIRDIHVPDPP